MTSVTLFTIFLERIMSDSPDLSMFLCWLLLVPRSENSVLCKSAIAAMHGKHSLVRIGNKSRQFRSVPVNALPRW